MSKHRPYHISRPLNVICAFILSATILLSCEKDPAGGGNNNPAPSALSERIILDTAYGTDANQKMDIYLPAGRGSSTKVIVMIHGGGWAAGDKSEMTFLRPMIKAEWPEAAVVNINYRLTSNPSVHHAEIMNDIKSAIRFITNNASGFAVSDTLALLGASAGAQLALLYTYRENQDNKVKCVSDVFGPAVINDWQWYNSWNIAAGISVKDILTLYNGSTWEADSTNYFANSPYVQVKASSKPTIIFHGNLDVIVPLYQSQWLNGKLGQLGVPHEYYEYPFQGHGFNDFYNRDMVKKSIIFFKKYMK